MCIFEFVNGQEISWEFINEEDLKKEEEKENEEKGKEEKRKEKARRGQLDLEEFTKAGNRKLILNVVPAWYKELLKASSDHVVDIPLQEKELGGVAKSKEELGGVRRSKGELRGVRRS